ncbi:uncharacterized protein LOC143428578 [Xylocopa sonorina]|uniref:uncharacterized protein LOC143428578 n=1 Tax=Xylocopa sonorina TaxID=1818115 RepID=UPI00403AF2F9
MGESEKREKSLGKRRVASLSEKQIFRFNRSNDHRKCICGVFERMIHIFLLDPPSICIVLFFVRHHTSTQKLFKCLHLVAAPFSGGRHELREPVSDQRTVHQPNTCCLNSSSY